MEINITKLESSIKLATDNKYPDLLAYASIKLIDEHQRFLIINGFTIRKSKFDNNPYLTPPSKKMGKGFFKFTLIEKVLWNEIEKETLAKYEKETIPLIEE
jgi:hypothetical protein